MNDTSVCQLFFKIDRFAALCPQPSSTQLRAW